jgi:hypothetical protein
MAEVNYTNTLAEQTNADAKAQQEQRNRAAFSELLARHELLANTEANYQMLVDFTSGDLTVAKGEFFLQNPPPGLALTFRDERESLIAAIIRAMHDPTERRFTKFDEQQLRKALAYKSRIELMQKLADVTRRQSMAKKTATELRQDLKDIRKAEGFGWNNTGYPRLAARIVPRGEFRAIPTGQFLRHIARTDVYELRRMCRLYSSAQVDHRLNTQDDEQ